MIERSDVKDKLALEVLEEHRQYQGDVARRLETAFADRDSVLWWIARGQLYDRVRDTPQFQAVMQKIGELKGAVQD